MDSAPRTPEQHAKLVHHLCELAKAPPGLAEDYIKRETPLEDIQRELTELMARRDLAIGEVGQPKGEAR